MRTALYRAAAAAALATLAGCAQAPLPAAAPSVDAAPAAPVEAAPAAAPCPAGLPAGVSCRRGVDSAGAPYLIAVPAAWNRVLVVHAHGGPALGAPKAERADEDVQRWAILLKAGYAWAASVFHQGGVAVGSAADDTERVRRIFVEHVARPRVTLLHGQSWGAGVAARTAERYATTNGRSPYDGVLLTSGVLGGRRSYEFRLDLRAVYQQQCHNHPRPDEADYPLWIGLPPSDPLTPAQLAARVDDCLGSERPAAQRSATQAARLKTVVDVIGIRDSAVLSHLAWATWHFQDIAERRSGGGNPFDNAQVRYRGSSDDTALNAQVARYRADPQALRRFGDDVDPTGRIPVPVLTVHAVGDPTAFVELESVFRQTMTAAGTADHLVQTFTRHASHSYLADAVYPTLLTALLRWVESGEKPTPAGIARDCQAVEAVFGPGCRFDAGYQPAPLESRVPARGP